MCFACFHKLQARASEWGVYVFVVVAGVRELSDRRDLRGRVQTERRARDWSEPRARTGDAVVLVDDANLYIIVQSHKHAWSQPAQDHVLCKLDGQFLIQINKKQSTDRSVWVIGTRVLVCEICLCVRDWRIILCGKDVVITILLWTIDSVPDALIVVNGACTITANNEVIMLCARVPQRSPPAQFSDNQPSTTGKHPLTVSCDTIEWLTGR